MNFLPCWQLDDDSPRECVYAHSINGEIFSVVVEGNGLIRVAKDDWLSKYSLAIHGDTEVSDPTRVMSSSLLAFVPRYLRILQRTPLSLLPVLNVDLIYKDELLLHYPTWIKFNQWLADNLQAEEEDQVKIHIELSTEFPEVSLEKLGDIVGVVSNISDTAGLVHSVADFTSLGNIAWFGCVGAILGVVSQVAFVVGGIIALTDAAHWQQKIEAVKAAAYATTAWIFEDLFPGEEVRLVHEDQDFPRLRFPIPIEIVRIEYLYKDEYRFDVEEAIRGTEWVTDELIAILKKWEEVSNKILEAMDQFADKTLASIHSRTGRRPTIEQFRSALRKSPIMEKVDNTGQGRVIGYRILTRRTFFGLISEVLRKQLLAKNPFFNFEVAEDTLSTYAAIKLRSLVTRFPPARNPDSQID